MRWLPALDNLVALPETPAALVDPADAEVEVATFGRPATGLLGTARHIFDRVLARDGRIVGLWAWRPADHDIAVHRFEDTGDVEAERVAVRDLLRDLGTGKRFSLDKDAGLARLAERIEALTEFASP